MKPLIIEVGATWEVEAIADYYKNTGWEGKSLQECAVNHGALIVDENGHVCYQTKEYSIDRYPEATVLTYQEWIELIATRKVVGYKLIKEYPGSIGKVGHIIKVGNCDGVIAQYKKYPEFWEPLYEEKKERVVVIQNENAIIDYHIKIVDDRAIALAIGGEYEFRKNEIASLLWWRYELINGLVVTPERFSIGCGNGFTRADLEKVYNAM
jgi:hypothetical protein